MDPGNYECYDTSISNCATCSNNFMVDLNLKNFTMAYIYNGYVNKANFNNLLILP